MLGSPVEVRYDDGDAVVLIQTDGGVPARNGDGGDGATETSQSATQNSQGSVAAGGTPESSRIIIHDAHGIEGCGSITIVTPNNLKISINTKRYDRQNGFQAARRTLTNDLRNKLGELDELLKASCDDEDRIVEHGEPSSTVTVQTQPTATTGSGMEEMPGTATSVTGNDAAGAWSLKPIQEPLYLLDDVLVRSTNDNELFYLGTVVDLEPNRDCVVRFDDATTRRFARTSVTRCNGTERQLRSMTRALSRDGDETARTTTPPPLLRFPPEFFPVICTKQLPYDLHGLVWDAHHRVNRTGNYCYCGDDGDWMREMIQCRRCDQWFHGRCVRSLQFPLFHGDTFYVFICSICNHGHEFVRRLVLTTANLAHLVLYNLIMRNGRRFYGLRTAILPYIEDNLRTLQLSEKFVKLTTNERADLLLNALKSSKERFYNGKEFTLSNQVWTLCQPAPPPIEPITIPIPPEETVTESILQQKLETTEHFRFLPRVYHEKNYFMDGATRERMLGLTYANFPESVSDPRTEICCIGSNMPTPTGTQTQKQSTTTTEPPVGAASSSPQPPAVAIKGDTNGPVGAGRRKRCGIRPTPVTLPMTAGGLDSFIPPPSNFDGPNNPFYEEESSSGSSGNGRPRYIYRKMGTIKRRACDMNQRYMSNAKRRKMGHSGSSSVRGAESRTRVLRKRALSDVVEESPNALSWDNVQRHNSEHNMNGGTAYVQQRSSATCSSSSCIVEQGDATVAAAAERQANSDGSCVEVKPLACGRRSSGRLIALGNKDYSDTRRYKRRREQDTVQQPDGANGNRHGSSRRSVVSDDTETDRSNGDRLSYSGFSTSGQSSSCELRKVYCEPESVKQSSQSSHQSSLVKCVVVGKRTLPNGNMELLLEEQD